MKLEKDKIYCGDCMELLNQIDDNSAYVTQKVCLTKEIAEKQIIKYNKKGWKPNFRIEEEKVIEK